MYSYDKRYSDHKAVFGKKPEKLLVDHYKKIDNSRPILDIGAGQGRHSLFLADEGFAVEALEPSEVGISQIKDETEKYSLPLHLTLGDISTFEPKAPGYSAILLFGIIQILTRDEIIYLIRSIKQWTTEGSLVFVTAFSTDEPSFEKHKHDDEEISKNSFKDAKGFIRTYLKPREILTLFDGFEVIHYDEHLTDMHHHGDGNIHQHAMIEALFRVE